MLSHAKTFTSMHNHQSQSVTVAYRQDNMINSYFNCNCWKGLHFTLIQKQIIFYPIMQADSYICMTV